MKVILGSPLRVPEKHSQSNEGQRSLGTKWTETGRDYMELSNLEMPSFTFCCKTFCHGVPK